MRPGCSEIVVQVVFLAAVDQHDLTARRLYNRSVTLADTTGVISKAPLTITAATNAKVYDGGVTAAATPTVAGTQPGDTVAGLADALRNSLFRNRLGSQPQRHHSRVDAGISSASGLLGVGRCVGMPCAERGRSAARWPTSEPRVGLR